MNNTSLYTRRVRQRAFTLIELLIVIAIIGILAALIFPITKGLKIKRMKSVAYAELSQMQTAIESYKAKRGFYPPDNSPNPTLNQLYFELSGTTNNPVAGTYTTLDGASTINTNNFTQVFGASTRISGFMNSSVGAGGSDDAAPATRFITGLRLNQIGQLILTPNGPAINALLVCSVGWLEDPSKQIVPNAAIPGLNPWQYVSSSPTNNPGTYDLWVDVVIDGRTNRISNWSPTPQIVP